MKLDWKTLGLGLFVLSQMKKKKAAPNGLSVTKGTQLSLAELRELAAQVGFSDPDLAASVAMAESGGFEEAVGDGGKSLGLWQVHTPSHPEFDASLLKTKVYNAQAALSIAKGGADWSPWTTFRSGAYQKYMPVAPPATEPVMGTKAHAAPGGPVRIELEDDDKTDVIEHPEVNGHVV